LAAPIPIAIDGLSKTYPGAAAPAVDGVSLDVGAGALTALVGGSGSGKTTLLKCVNRLVRPDRGQVLIDGRPNDATDPAALRRGIGYVFQHIGLFPHLTVAENIAAVPRLLGWPKGEIAARVGELLDLVGLPAAFAGRAPAALSGGQQQRVGLARALAARPRVMLMDEPFGALDPITRDELGRAYRRLHDQLGLTTVMVTHDVQEAVLLADRIAVMAEGRLLAHDTPHALMTRPQAPAVAALMETPRRQAERVQALLRAEDGGHG